MQLENGTCEFLVKVPNGIQPAVWNAKVLVVVDVLPDPMNP